MLGHPAARFVAKAAVAAALLAYLYYSGLFSLAQIKQVLWSSEGVVALLWALAALVLALLRWHLLVRAFATPLSLFATGKIFFTGAFVNNFLPSSMGGDAARAYYLSRLHGQTLRRAAMIVLLDRVLGAVGLFGLLALVGAVWFGTLNVNAIFMPIMVALWLGFGVAAVLLASGGWWIALAERMLTRAPSRFAGAAEKIQRLLDMARNTMKRPWVLFGALMLSVGVQLSMVAALAQLLENIEHISIGIPPLVVSNCFAGLAGMLPITPGGVGVGEAAFAYFAGWYHAGVTAAGFASVFFAFRLLGLLLSLPGALAWLRLKKVN